MADQKLNELTALPSAIEATDLIYVVRNSTDYKATGNDFPAGDGDVVGPASATDGAPALFDGATGKLLKNSTPTGSGNPVLATSPMLTTPVLGVATATSINKVAITAPATSATLTIADGKTLTASNTLTFTGTDASSVAFGGGGTVLYNGGALGTPSSGTLTNCTNLPVSSGISGLGTGVATALAVNVGSAGAFVTFNGALGTPSSGTLTNATGLPISSGVSGLGTNVATALAVNVGSAGAFVTFNGALGTPSSGTLTNCTGLPTAGLVDGAVTNAKMAASAKTGSIQFGKSNNGSALSTGTIDFAPQIPFGATITAWSISVDTGTATVKFWKKAAGTAIPTVADVINTSGVAISSGTHVRSTTLTDFTTTTISANDLFRCDLTAVSSATWINVQLEYERS